MVYKVDLVVRPRKGIRDPQAEAVEDTLGGVGYSGIKIDCVGRFLKAFVEADSEEKTRELVDDMCKRILVNPNLETYEIKISPA